MAFQLHVIKLYATIKMLKGKQQEESREKEHTKLKISRRSISKTTLTVQTSNEQWAMGNEQGSEAGDKTSTTKHKQ